MKPDATVLAQNLERRLQALERERNHVLALLALYKNAASDDMVTTAKSGALEAMVPSDKPRRTRARSATGGPTERILAVLRQSPGLRYAEIIERAKVDLRSGADNPERSIGSSLQALVKRGRIDRRDGRHYPTGRHS